jgi:hypothetical protein
MRYLPRHLKAWKIISILADIIFLYTNQPRMIILTIISCRLVFLNTFIHKKAILSHLTLKIAWKCCKDSWKMETATKGSIWKLPSIEHLCISQIINMQRQYRVANYLSSNFHTIKIFSINTLALFIICKIMKPGHCKI